jgi:hypothetical protein
MRHPVPAGALALLVASLSILAAPGLLASCSEVEPNEQLAQASVLPAGEPCGGEARTTDGGGLVVTFPDGTPDPVEDLFTLTIGAPSRVELTLRLSGSADLDLYLFTASGGDLATVALSTDGGAVERIRLEELPAGTYYAGVSAYSGGSAYTLTSSVSSTGAACVEDDTTLCLSGGRFRVAADWRTEDGRSGKGHAVRLTPDTGTFWFFDSTNLEMMVKVLNACAFAGRHWVFAGGLTDVNVTLTVTDTTSGQVKTYVNPQKTAFAPIQDTGAFATCP